jgi:hypothetical protein
MKEHRDILDAYGTHLVRDVYDDGLRYFLQILSGATKWGTGKEYSEVLSKLNEQEKEIILKYVKDLLGTCLFGFLKIFEEHEQFKLYYESGNQKVNLAEITEMLKAEPIIENGWIDRFSEYSAKKDKESFQ